MDNLNVTWTINTEFALFARWLDRHFRARRWFESSGEALSVMYYVEPEPDGASCYTFEGVRKPPGVTNYELPEDLELLGVVMEFSLVPLSGDRLQVEARCCDPTFAGYYLTVIAAVSAAWAEASHVLNTFLSQERDSGVEGHNDELPLKESGSATKARVKSLNSGPRVPGRLPDFLRWQHIWKLIRNEVEQGHSYKETTIWLGKMHPKDRISAELLADIAKAGKSGSLDGQLTM